MDKEYLDAICQGFRKCIQTHMKRVQKKSSNNKKSSTPKKQKQQQKLIHHLIEHSIHILKRLFIKRHSLSLAITAFQQICKECIDLLLLVKKTKMTTIRGKNNNNSNNNTQQRSLSISNLVQQILRHVFIQYIHINDGFVLLTSGECRHTADSNIARRERELNNKHGGRKRKRNEQFHDDDDDDDDNNNDNGHDDDNDNDGFTFASRLNTMDICHDGYTKLYSSNCGYSGYAWDEFYNENVGVKRRLLDALLSLKYHSNNDHTTTNCTNSKQQQQQQRENIWEKLSHLHGFEGFENQFNAHEMEMKELKEKLQRIMNDFKSALVGTLKSTIVQQIMLLQSNNKNRPNNGNGGSTTNTILSSSNGSGDSSTSASSRGMNNNVSLSLKSGDKAEELTLYNAQALGLREWTIKRQGDDFKGKGKHGALPSHIKSKDWLEIMKLPLSLKCHMKEVSMTSTNNCVGDNTTSASVTKKKVSKNRNRVIFDSSDEEDDCEEENNEALLDGKIDESCLKVSMTKTKDEDKTTPSKTSSIYDIKKQLGVNVELLEQSREGVEQEELRTKKAAFADELGDVDNEMIENVGQNDNQHPDEEGQQQHSNDKTREQQIFDARKKRLDQLASSNGVSEYTLSQLRKEHNLNSSFPRNDINRNIVNPLEAEPTSTFIIGGDHRHSTYQQNRMIAHSKQTTKPKSSNSDAINEEFRRNFNSHDMDANEGEVSLFVQDEQRNQNNETIQQYRKWGDELLTELGHDINIYPCIAPEKPIEMINGLGIESESTQN
jgi:hypothetical protein